MKESHQPRRGTWPWVVAIVFSQPNAHRLVWRTLAGVALVIYTCAMVFCGRPGPA